jgi:hypothetical protein
MILILTVLIYIATAHQAIELMQSSVKLTNSVKTGAINRSPGVSEIRHLTGMGKVKVIRKQTNKN